MQNHQAAAAVEWSRADVAAMLDRLPHLTAMEAARRSGWTVWAVQTQFGRG